ncbi:hypothetical protein CoNPh26_CDS0109 [Staphylococcus phage S-CoN_Ph26]|nr:hypothetical protein CoNPh26_CDS0109 [Staphylococcus phage S-CoN_Ph26]
MIATYNAELTDLKYRAREWKQTLILLQSQYTDENLMTLWTKLIEQNYKEFMG